MNEILPLIESEKKRLLKELTEKYPDFGLSNISEIADSLDTFLKCFTNDSLRLNSRIFLNLEICEDSYLLIDETSIYYELSFSDIFDNPSNLTIFLGVRGIIEKYKQSNFTFEIEGGHGKYKSFTFIHPTKHQIRNQEIEELLKSIFEVGYNWYISKTLQLVKNIEDSLGYRLYDYIKTINVHKNLLKNLWFASITESHGFRLLNEKVVESAFLLIDQNSDTFSSSTNKFVAELLTTKLSESQLLMKQAIIIKKPIDANLKEAKYKKTDSLYATTLRLLYGSDSFTVYPIFVTDKLSVVTLFDTKNKNVIIPILEAHSIELEDMCNQSISSIKGLLNRLRKAAKNIVESIFKGAILQPNIAGVGFDFKEFAKSIKNSSK